MPFNSWTFLVFFGCVFVLHRVMPTWTLRKRVLLLASYVFYAAWNPPYVLILLFSTTFDWWLARRIWRTTDQRRRRLLLLSSLICNLGLLGFFKYGSFLLENFQSLLSLTGVAYHAPQDTIVLPIGISFYTFASLSYTIDVYRREIDADQPWLDYALFVSFFPHLVAGPIVRARVLLPQIAQPRQASADQLGWGLTLVIAGLFCKVVLADNIFAPVVDAVYLAPDKANALDAWLAVFGFSAQIYYDFNGYSLCAIGLALCFGFAFPDNFRHPYAARSFSDFWRRWHISLSTWLRDYLYIPLGGSRHGAARTCASLMLTMLIGGLWHGASWMFVLWGGLHGTYLVLERQLRPRFASMPAPEWLTALLVFVVVSLTWVPFRAPSLEAMSHFVAAFLRLGAEPRVDLMPATLCLLGVAATLRWHHWLRDRSLEEGFGQFANLAQTTAIGFCLVAMYLYGGGEQRAFIYFQF